MRRRIGVLQCFPQLLLHSLMVSYALYRPYEACQSIQVSLI